MSPADSKALVVDAWKTFATRDPEAIARCFAPDAEWIAQAGNATAVALEMTHHIVGREVIAAFLAEGFRELLRDAQVQFTAIHADENRVVVEETTRATLPGGAPYENDYCFVFELEGGRIRRVREYMDTLRGWRQVFGPAAAPAPAGA
ncbi:nuclear transport factor 2 family protein [Phenylobacterium sp.]|jgi:hypothetical protein|uniref:nuclear transport factor 2 family protein n=1 Tax=Phenylobacterium sp. TaxID=1871053 RepID=UPI002E339EA6|nr:nuclear transport factor 2 family protein [Phenylobacterium sp.]HEX2561669.1 nuclear transport factor 2 family protein [Phenylobacterium sp.]